MIIKILPSSGNDFHGVQYNDKKVENGKGELMLMKNFPSFISVAITKITSSPLSTCFSIVPPHPNVSSSGWVATTSTLFTDSHQLSI